VSAVAGAFDLEGAAPDLGRVTVVADARLDERGALAHELGIAASDVTDGELIRLAYLRWGDACVEHLLGDFAFVLCDGPNRRLVAARDPFGVKPLHYHHGADRLTFATDVTDVFSLGVPCELDERRITDALVPELEGIDATSTFFRGVVRLPPGHRLAIERGGSLLTRTFTLDATRELRLKDDRAYVDAFLSTFREAVHDRLDAGTVSMLSGGLDSSAIVGVAKGRRKLTTVSAVTDGPGCEETAHVRAMIASGGLDPILVRPEDVATVLGPAIDRFLTSWAEPFDATMILPVSMYAAARAAGASAVLDGVDGDLVASLEPDYLDAVLRRGRFGQAREEASGLARFYRLAGTEGRPGRLLLRSARRAFLPRAVHRTARRLRRGARHAESLRDSLLDPDLARRVRIDERLDALAAHRPAGRSLDPRARQAGEILHPYVAAALERYHRAASSQGVEARHPFLDRRLVELCLALPWDQKVRGGWSKSIVRRAMAGILPDDVRWRSGRWVHLGAAFVARAIEARVGEAEPLAADTVSALEPYVDLVAWRAVVDRFFRARDPIDGDTVWRTLVLARWLRAVRESSYDTRAHRLGAAALSPRRGARANMVAGQHDSSA
jgi:asparagine synthase (glutamine-hydrolysing)